MLDLRFFGFALRLRWEWLGRTAHDSCWARLPFRSEKSIAAIAAVSMTVNIGDGASARLWTDSWASVGALCHYAPNLYAAISRAGKKRSLKDGIFQNRWARDLVGAPTTQVLCQYLWVWGILCDVDLHPLQEDRFVWRWTADGSPHRPRIEPSSPAHRRCWEPTNYGRPKHRRARSSSGWRYITAYGPRNDAEDMGCRMMMLASFAAKKQRLVIICSLGASLPDSSGSPCWHPLD